MEALFSSPADVLIGNTWARLSLKIEVQDPGGNQRIAFSVADKDGTQRSSVSFAVTGDDLNAGFTYDNLTRVVTLELDFNNPQGGADPAEIRELGIAGLSFHAAGSATLASIKVVLRPRPPGGDWSVQAPCFSLIACWAIQAKAGAGGVDSTSSVKIEADATVEAEICTYLAAVLPNMGELGIPNLQLKIDVPTFGLSMDWASLSLFESADSLFHFDGLTNWFAKLTNFKLPDEIQLSLPNWTLDRPVNLSMPLGIDAQYKYLRVHPNTADTYTISVAATNFFVTWSGSQFDVGGALNLEWDSTGQYKLVVTVFEKYYPRNPQEAVKRCDFALPFDVLTLSAACWRVRLGYFAKNRPQGGFSGCFELLLEIGDLQISSALKGGGKSAMHTTDLRLLVRDAKVMTDTLLAGPALFEDVPEPFASAYSNFKVPALSFAADLKAAPPPVSGTPNDYGMTFLEGDFSEGPRLFLAWRQAGARFLKALAHDLLGDEPAGSLGADEAQTLFALEIISSGSDRQLRLDWKSVNAPLTVLAQQVAPLASSIKNGCLNLPTTGQMIAFPIPLEQGSTGVDDTPPPQAVRHRLAALELTIARPVEQAIVLGAEQDKGGSVSHLVFFPTWTSDPTQALPAIAVARLGFSLTDRAGNETRQVAETGPMTDTSGQGDQPYLTVALGHAGATPLAIRTLGWRVGSVPRFLQVVPPDAAPLVSLLDNFQEPSPTGTDPGCPGPAKIRMPAALLAFDAFQSPSFTSDGWRLGVKIAASEQLFKMFGTAADADQKVSFRIASICQPQGVTGFDLQIELTFRLGSDFLVSGRVILRFDPRDLSLCVADDAQLAFRIECDDTTPPWALTAPLDAAPDDFEFSTEITLFGLKLTALRRKPKHQEPAPPPTPEIPKRMDVFKLTLDGGRFMLTLLDDCDLVIRYDNLGGDSLAFRVDSFCLGPGGLDLEAALIPGPLRLKGLSKSFALEQASLRIRASKLDYLTIHGDGALPDILDNTPIKLILALKQTGNSIELADLDCTLGNKGQPILSRGTRFKFELEQLGLHYSSGADGDRSFYFEITGSACFSPDENEFTTGLLADFRSIRIEFIRAPLSDSFIENVQLVVELKQPKTFEVFKLFRMTVRSIGFHPKFAGFKDPTAAIIIGGQCEFADIGDILSAKLDFHAMYIGMPAGGKGLPQIYFDGLRVDISSPEGFRIAGRVDRYDSTTQEGFAGEGTVQIPGFPELSAAIAFVKVREDERADWKRAWFIAIEASKISYQIAPLPLYLRQIGLGFGYRYTITLVKEFRERQTIRELLQAMLKALDRYQSLARIDSWITDLSGNGTPWTIAMDAVFTVGTGQSSPLAYQAVTEKKVQTLVAQVIAAFRSDFTLVTAAKLWYPISVDDFFRDESGMRSRPLASGFMIYSAPQSRFLAHVAKGANPYMGPKDQPVPEVIKDILKLSHFEATLLIEPGLFHAELGWPDRLAFGFKLGGLNLECRGGVLMRIERDLMIQGIFFSARGQLSLSGGIDAGFIGAKVEAQAIIQFATRMLIGTYPSKPDQGAVYAAHGLDICVRFSVAAWFRIKTQFFSIRIDIGFALELQILVALEMGTQGLNMGFRGRATVLVGAFGRRLAIHVAVGLNESGLDEARNRLSPYMGSLLEAGKAPPMPGFDKVGLGNTEALKAFATVTPGIALAMDDLLPLDPSDPRRDDFVTVHVDGARDDDQQMWFVWIMPGPVESVFYPPVNDQDDLYAYLDLTDLSGDIFVPILDKASNTWMWVDTDTEPKCEIRLRKCAIPIDDQKTPFGLNQLVAGCWHLQNPSEVEKDQQSFPLNWPDYSPTLAWPYTRTAMSQKVRSHPPTHNAPGANEDFIAEMLEPDETINDSSDQVKAQAMGNQALLLQALHDDLVRIAQTTRFVSGRPDSPSPPPDKPSLFHLGMIVCVRAKSKPEWINKRPETSSATKYPTLKFVKTPKGADAVLWGTFELAPVIDFDALDFEHNSPDIPQINPHFDEDSIGVRFDINWAGTAPSFAKGAQQDVESYLRCYEITFSDASRGTTLKCVTVSPADVASKSTYRRTSYQYLTSTQQLLPKGFAGVQTLVQVGVSIVPISQTGSRGAIFSSVMTFEPVLTPLPPEDLHLRMGLLNAAAVKANAPAQISAAITWRQPSLPTTPGVAATAGWQLVLRPLRGLPLGAYPDEALDTTDRGLMSVTGQALAPGDIVIVLPEPLLRFTSDSQQFFSYSVPKPPANNSPDEPAPADRLLTLDLDRCIDLQGLDVYDHHGIALPDKSPQREDALWFFQRRSAAVDGGRAWRLFVRATSYAGTRAGEWLAKATGLSGLTPVQLHLLAANETRDAAKSKSAPLRILPHFEWPTPNADSGLPQVKCEDIVAQVAGVKVPVMQKEVQTEMGIQKDQLVFVDRPGRARMISITWNAKPSSGNAQRPLTAYAAYNLFECPLESLLNADLKSNSGFTAQWKHVTELVPSNAALARQTPATLSDVPNWEAQTPLFVLTQDFLHQRDVMPDDMKEQWPVWFSWAESELHWPTPIFLTAMRAGKTDLGKLDRWRDLGRVTTNGLLHEYLAVLVGCLVDEAGQGSQAERQVQVIAGKGSAITDPLKWLMADTEALDPYGWAALERLGLSAVITLRDPYTGILLDAQAHKTELLNAIDKVIKEAQRVQGSDIEIELRKHLYIDLPIQHPHAYRAGTDSELLENIGLSMIQLSLRPLPDRAFTGEDEKPLQVFSYEVISLTGQPKSGAILKLSADCEVVFKDSSREPLVLAKAIEHDASLLKKGDVVFVRFENGKENYETVFSDALRIARVTFEPYEDYANYPLPLLPSRIKNLDTTLSPFGRFPVDPRLWKQRLVDQGSTSLTRLLDYLQFAFANTPEELQSGPQSTPGNMPTWRGELARVEASMDDLRAAYMIWSARFFRSAPIAWSLDSKNEYTYIGTAQPKSLLPLRIAVDGRGTLIHSRLLDEEWAGERAYAVVPVGRYERLWRSWLGIVNGERTEPLIKPPSSDRDVAHVIFPRVRKLEPPKLLHAWARAGENGRRYHDLVVVHGERDLAIGNNLPTRRKISFGAIWYSYTRRFAEEAWMCTLTNAELLHTPITVQLPEPLDAETAEAIAFDSTASAQTLLAQTPDARWGASRYVVSAEPYYYIQSVKLFADAGERIWSSQKTTVLPAQAPDVLRPLPESKAVVTREPLPWSIVNDHKTAFASACTSRFAQSDSRVRPHLAPTGEVLRIRLARLIESLDPYALANHYAYEVKTRDRIAPVGLLPDPHARVLLVDQSDGVTMPLVQVSCVSASTSQVKPASAFRFDWLSGDLQKLPITIEDQATWPTGLRVRVPLAPVFSARCTGPEAAQMLPLAHPRTLAQVWPDVLLAADEWPDTPRMLQLAPLAVRLTVIKDATSTVLTQNSPLMGGRYLVRPSTAPPADPQVPAEPITADDFFIGVRLVLDVERRRAAGLLAFDAAIGLLQRVETASFAILFDARIRSLTSFPPAWSKKGVQVWRRKETSAGVVWEQITEDQRKNDDFHLFMIDAFDPEDGDPTDALNSLNERLEGERKVGITKLLATNTLCTELAAAAYRSVAYRPPVVQVCRGNGVPQIWQDE